jgi:hypothetical protein
LNTGASAGACARAFEDSTNHTHVTKRNADVRKLME